MSRYIILENPAICSVCHKLIRAGRGAFWGKGIATCYTCVRKAGEAKESAEEKAMTATVQEE